MGSKAVKPVLVKNITIEGIFIAMSLSSHSSNFIVKIFIRVLV